MNTPAADDYSAIKARMEEIERERARAFDVFEVDVAVGQYLGNEPAKEPAIQTYMGWDIYPPVNLNN